MGRKITHADKHRWRMLWVQNEVIHRLGWDLGAYTEFKHWAGVEYLWAYMGICGATKVDFNRITASPVYWGWWKKYWTEREEEWLVAMKTPTIYDENGLAGYGKKYMESIYRQVHDPYVLAMGKTEAGMRLEVSYGRELVPGLK